MDRSTFVNFSNGGLHPADERAHYISKSVEDESADSKSTGLKAAYVSGSRNLMTPILAVAAAAKRGDREGSDGRGIEKR